ncbi:MAG: C39 family peptidase [Chloroflexi bacterium]|nr:C39 family peptidase [Chloroflexota bacterium]MCI0577855.1 C39 family peptidase [Chloroflexota bacterium]MCI0643837.1 C39 family peptidase [Chloroflexota bacterium]MCI0728229.1 C39 family peptidase [Chloroflexota bacterium]
MPRRYSEPIEYFQIRRAHQISESHCGPAVIQMLLSNLGIEVTQEMVAESGGAAEYIELQGMRPDQLALAVRQLAPQTQFWYKKNAKLKELIRLVDEFRHPVGVEWQGIFDGDEEDEDDDEDDYGHFSVVTYVDLDKNELIIVDPYKDYVSRDHILTFAEFASRWWDYNEFTDPKTDRSKLVEDYHYMFIITPAEETFPLQLRMKKG